MSTIRKVHANEYQYTTGPWVRGCPAGYAIIDDDTGKPVIWENCKGAINMEVYIRKYAAESMAAWKAEHGIDGTMLEWDD